MRKITLLIVYSVLLLLSRKAFGQQNQITPFTLTSIPASPMASEMTKYGGLPINHSTGAPNYTIPIFSKEIGNGLNLDVSLHYNTNGIKVQELAGVVGLGWSLFAGGVISRTVNDDPDKYSMVWRHPLKRILWEGNAKVQTLKENNEIDYLYFTLSCCNCLMYWV